jgi:hypothetical protein
MQTGRPFKFLVRHHGIFFTGLCRFLYRIMQISHVIFRRQIAANIAQAAGVRQNAGICGKPQLY